MTLASILTYSSALFIAAAIPGPGMTAIVARALGSGFRETLFMGFGLILGDLVYLTAVILGLALLAEAFTGIFLAIKIGGALYLFLRGSQSPGRGIHAERPPRALIEALDHLFARRATTEAA